VTGFAAPVGPEGDAPVRGGAAEFDGGLAESSAGAAPA
jgi:hypothetical protein